MSFIDSMCFMVVNMFYVGIIVIFDTFITEQEMKSIVRVCNFVLVYNTLGLTVVLEYFTNLLK